MKRPSDNYILTRADAERLSTVARRAEQKLGGIKARYRRRVIQRGGTGGSSIHFAFCKAAASTGSTITCYLDTDATGTEITVNCTLIEATNLNACFPTLSDGTAIPVVNTTNGWWCLWWFQGTEVCP